jgi:hypothetical protein
MAKRKKKPAITEAEWLAHNDPVAMIQFVTNHPRASPRVLRLYMAAFWTWQAPRLQTLPEQKQLRKRAALVEKWGETGKRPRGVTRPENGSTVFLYDDANTAAFETARAPTYWGKRGEEATVVQPPLLRELFGPHPFRRVVANPEWLTSTVVALAQGIFEERAFDRMPILGDALQDAGCADEDVLNHCSMPQETHIRGCWVLDLLLGKT